MKKEQEQRNVSSTPNMKPLTFKSFAPCPHYQRTNHSPEKCWSGPNAANKPKRFKQDHPADNRNDGHLLRPIALFSIQAPKFRIGSFLLSLYKKIPFMTSIMSSNTVNQKNQQLHYSPIPPLFKSKFSLILCESRLTSICRITTQKIYDPP